MAAQDARTKIAPVNFFKSSIFIILFGMQINYGAAPPPTRPPPAPVPVPELMDSEVVLTWFAFPSSRWINALLSVCCDELLLLPERPELLDWKVFCRICAISSGSAFFK